MAVILTINREPLTVNHISPLLSWVAGVRAAAWFLVGGVVVAATLIVATLGDVLLARCSGSSLRVNLQPTHLVRELAAELGGYGATQSALAVGCVQHLGGCHV